MADPTSQEVIEAVVGHSETAMDLQVPEPAPLGTRSITMPGLNAESLALHSSPTKSVGSNTNTPQKAGNAAEAKLTPSPGHHLRPKGVLKVSSSVQDMRHGAHDGAEDPMSPAGDVESQSDAQRAASLLSNEGVTNFKRKRFHEALRLFTRARDTLVGAFGSRHREVANALNNMALVHRRLKNLDRSASLYEDALAIDLVTLQKNDPLIGTTMFNLARVHEENNHLNRAMNLLQSALDIKRANVASGGTDEASVSKVLYHLAFVHKAMGNQHAFHTTMAEATALNIRIHGHDHKTTQKSIKQLLAGGTPSKGKSSSTQHLHKKKKSGGHLLAKKTSAAQIMMSVDEPDLGNEKKE